MRLFKNKKEKQKHLQLGPTCPHCKSTNTVVLTDPINIQPYIRIWRGQRFMTCRCLECGQDFYSKYISREHSYKPANEDDIIENEYLLRAAEEEIKKQVDDQDDRRCR